MRREETGSLESKPEKNTPKKKKKKKQEKEKEKQH
jgi:hypothetical protein